MKKLADMTVEERAAARVEFIDAMPDEAKVAPAITTRPKRAAVALDSPLKVRAIVEHFDAVSSEALSPAQIVADLVARGVIAAADERKVFRGLTRRRLATL